MIGVGLPPPIVAPVGTGRIVPLVGVGVASRDDEGGVNDEGGVDEENGEGSETTEPPCATGAGEGWTVLQVLVVLTNWGTDGRKKKEERSETRRTFIRERRKHRKSYRG